MLTPFAISSKHTGYWVADSKILVGEMTKENEPYHCGAGGSVIEIHFPTSSFPAYPDPNPVSIEFAGDIKKIGGKATLEIVFHANPEPKEFRSS